MPGFDEEWRTGKVLVCTVTGGRVRVWLWAAPDRPGVVEHAVATARYIARETRSPAWIEHYGAPAARPADKRGFPNYRTGGID